MDFKMYFTEGFLALAKHQEQVLARVLVPVWEQVLVQPRVPVREQVLAKHLAQAQAQGWEQVPE
jgi:hypothetical protein